MHYLDNHQEGLPASDLGVVPQFGTAEWTEDDAISFAHALSEGAYGKAGAYLLRLMGLPKEPPLEELQQPSAPPLDWGAGAVFPGSWKPAWKAGWGGSQDQPPHYLGGQIAVLHLGALPVAATAVFVPRIEPPNDNPGLTRAPQAIELMFKGARAGSKGTCGRHRDDPCHYHRRRYRPIVSLLSLSPQGGHPSRTMRRVHRLHHEDCWNDCRAAQSLDALPPAKALPQPPRPSLAQSPTGLRRIVSARYAGSPCRHT